MTLNQILVTIILCVFCFELSASCNLNEKTNIVTCASFEDLNAAGSHPEWTNLTIENSEKKPLQILKNNAFKNVPNLEILKLDGIINEFENAAFKELNKLKQLDLLNNNIPELPENIFNELNLNLLLIENSKLESIPANYFTKMNNLQLLRLNNNSISSIGDCAFCNLNNTYIILDNNSIKSFEPIRVLGSKSLIRGLNLDENHLTVVPLFGEMPELVGASFINNSIKTFEGESLRNAPKLMLLDISFNKVQNIPSNALPDIFSKDEYTFLVLHNNNMKCVSKEIRDKVKKLRRITVNDNPWQCECLKDIISWAKNMNAYVGCDFIDTCKVPCVDNQNASQIISFK